MAAKAKLPLYASADGGESSGSDSVPLRAPKSVSITESTASQALIASDALFCCGPHGERRPSWWFGEGESGERTHTHV